MNKAEAFFRAVGIHKDDDELRCRQCDSAIQPLLHVDVQYELGQEAVAIVADDVCVSCYALWIYPVVEEARSQGAELTRGVIWPMPLR